jgi:hypothetical protein
MAAVLGAWPAAASSTRPARGRAAHRSPSSSIALAASAAENRGQTTIFRGAERRAEPHALPVSIAAHYLTDAPAGIAFLRAEN